MGFFSADNDDVNILLNYIILESKYLIFRSKLNKTFPTIALLYQNAKQRTKSSNNFLFGLTLSGVLSKGEAELTNVNEPKKQDFLRRKMNISVTNQEEDSYIYIYIYIYIYMYIYIYFFLFFLKILSYLATKVDLLFAPF